MHYWSTTLLRAITAIFLAAANSKNNNNNANLAQLEMRLQLGYEAAKEARSFVAEKQYKEAAQSFMDALNLGRKPTLTLQEMKPTTINNNESSGQQNNDSSNDDQARLVQLRQESLQWLIDLCCESATLKMDHLDDLDSARADAWAACVFSQNTLRTPLDCMRKVCSKGNDLFGEFQACKQLLDLSDKERLDDQEREELSNRLQEIEKAFSL